MQRRDFLKLSTALGVASALPWWNQVLAAERPVLPIPALLAPDEQGVIRLNAQPGQMQWRRQPTRTWGYNGNLLGPTLRARQGQSLTMQVNNQLSETTTIHWHGLPPAGITPIPTAGPAIRWRWGWLDSSSSTMKKASACLCPAAGAWMTFRSCCRTNGSMARIKWITGWM